MSPAVPARALGPSFESLRLSGFLSFSDAELPLRSLNVLIGPNASGKSNLIEAVAVLQAAPRDLVATIREGGGVRDWLWKGNGRTASAAIEAVVSNPDGQMPLRYSLRFAEVGQRFEITDERIEGTEPLPGHSRPYLYFGYEKGRAYLDRAELRKIPPEPPQRLRELEREEINPQQSILAQRKDPLSYPELTHVGRLFDSLRIYRNWSLGPDTAPRRPQPADLPNDFLLEDFRNLGLVVNRLERDPTVKRNLLRYLKQVSEAVEDVDVSVEGGTVQLFIHEERRAIPATRASDGTLRWLALLGILLHPTPPPLVCIEEPEVGLHPDLLPVLAGLLREASTRMQLIVTTHSEVLVDALSEVPELVIVCEQKDGSTVLRRLEKSELDTWLDRYTLGQLWRKGEIGGNRW